MSKNLPDGWGARRREGSILPRVGPRAIAHFALAALATACSGSNGAIPVHHLRAAGPVADRGAAAIASEADRDPDVGPVVGSSQAGSGVSFHYEYHTNRNALLAGAVVDHALIALTRAGHLLRFELPQVSFDGELISSIPYVALGNDVSGGIIAAREDGVVARVDAKTLREEWIGRLPGEPFWLRADPGSDGSSWSVIAILKRPDWVEEGGRRWQVDRFSIHDATTGASWDLPDQVDVAHLDRSGRLWLGADHGEFGGWIGRFDLATGSLHDYKAACREAREADAKRMLSWFAEPENEDVDLGCDGVYGFLERSDGEIWAYGGVAHMGLRHGYVLRLGDDRVEFIAELGQTVRRIDRREEPPQGEPLGPITHLVEGPGADLILLSYGDMFRTSADLSSWSKIGELRVRYFAGRPDAVGVYPAILDAIPLDEPDAALVFTTRRDGVLSVHGTEVQRHALPGQLEATEVVEIGATDDGPIFIDGYDYADLDPPWRRIGSWERLDLAPPREPSEGYWRLQSVFTDLERAIVGIFENNRSPGERLTVRWHEAKPEILEETSKTGWGIWSTFTTPDGSWWARERDALLRFQEDGWNQVGVLPGDCGYCRLRFVGGGGPPWLLRDERDDTLWELHVDRGGTEARLERIELADIGDVFAALPLEKEQFLLASDTGLAQLDLPTASTLPVELDRPPASVKALGRDGSGRIWMAGEGVWVLDRNGGIHDVTPPLLFPGSQATLLAGNPRDPQGMILSLGTRGVVFLHAN